MKGILATKKGMTLSIKADGTVIPVTVLEAGPCFVISKKTKAKDGYEAVQIGYKTKKSKKEF